MTDELFVANETVSERADVASKGKSRTSKLGSENEHKSWKELRKLNGDVITCNPNRPIKWAEFEKYSIEQQKHYVQSIYDRFHCTVEDMANMFGVSCDTVKILVNNLNVTLLKQPVRTEVDKFNWRAFCATKYEEVLKDEPKRLSKEEYQTLNDDDRLAWLRSIKKIFPNVSLRAIEQCLGFAQGAIEHWVRHRGFSKEFAVQHAVSRNDAIKAKQALFTWYGKQYVATAAGNCTATPVPEEQPVVITPVELVECKPIDNLSQALKKAMNSVYGLTAAKDVMKKNPVNEGSLTFEGDWEAVSKIISAVLGNGEYKINIQFNRIGDSE